MILETLYKLNNSKSSIAFAVVGTLSSWHSPYVYGTHSFARSAFSETVLVAISTFSFHFVVRAMHREQKQLKNKKKKVELVEITWCFMVALGTKWFRIGIKHSHTISTYPSSSENISNRIALTFFSTRA